jgi:DNA-binding NtrC family response regulator
MEEKLKNKIFIVDDEEGVRDVFKKVLISKGYEVEVFPNSEGLLSYIISSPPDLLIMDLNLPWEKGEDFIERFKSIEKIGNLPVIVISGKKMLPSNIEHLKIKGVSSFFSKPFDIQDILNEMSKILM